MERRHPTAVAAVVATVLLLGSFPSLARAEAIDGACDVEISLNSGSLVDGVVEAYYLQEAFPIGVGFPPLAEVRFDYRIDGTLVESYVRTTNAEGRANYDRYQSPGFYFGLDYNTSAVEGAITATYLGGGEPCTDTVPLVHLGPVPVFDDIYRSRFIEEILWLHEAGIVSGCNEAYFFCPTSSVKRSQMAAYLARALDLPPTSDDFFDDDDGLTLEWAINRVAAAGLAVGCGERLYCPGLRVTRAEMAAFLVRGFELPASNEDFFDDDDGITLESSVNALAAAGITGGCRSADPRVFCPNLYVKREQMAAFLYRLLA